MNDTKRWLLTIALALIIMVAGCVMVNAGEPGAGALLLFLCCFVVVIGVVIQPEF